MGTFIKVEVHSDAMSTASRQQVARLCPVDIFGIEADGQLVIKADNEDECTLCELCLKVAPSDTLFIHKLYKDETLVAVGQNL